ncbi:MAG: dihydropteroate synthase [Actinobacteria bacterium]|nr:dihydropteroate synthase [Actinomycetota bacterium]
MTLEDRTSIPVSSIPLVMGIVNVTPDSFSDGGRFLRADDAVAHGLELLAEGASILDIGGESTRPGASPVTIDEEIARVVPVVEALAAHGRVSVDTRRPEVARAAVAAGATLINDVSASLWPVAAELGVGWVAMHMQGEPATMQLDPTYTDVVAEVCAFLEQRATEAATAGVAEIWIDPGFGFGKTLEHNLTLLAHLDRLVALGWPVVVGTSRKATLGRILADSDGVADPVDPQDRLAGSIATEVWAMHRGAAMIRAHDVRAAVQAAKVVAA